MKHIATNNSESSLTRVEPADVQPNAVDLKVFKIFRVNTGDFVLGTGQKKHRGSQEIEPSYIMLNPYGDKSTDSVYGWQLDPGAYEILFDGDVKMGAAEAGWVISRSTLIRNGAFLTSGLYDSGYEGVMAGCLHVTTGKFVLEQGARVGQFLLFDAESVRAYDGSYGKNSEHDKKYGS